MKNYLKRRKLETTWTTADSPREQTDRGLRRVSLGMGVRTLRLAGINSERWERDRHVSTTAMSSSARHLSGKPRFTALKAAAISSAPHYWHHPRPSSLPGGALNRHKRPSPSRIVAHSEGEPIQVAVGNRVLRGSEIRPASTSDRWVCVPAPRRRQTDIINRPILSATKAAKTQVLVLVRGYRVATVASFR